MTQDSDRKGRHRKKRLRFRMRHPRRRAPIGAAPGTLVADPEALPLSMHVLAYGPDGLTEQQLERPEDIREFLGRWPVVWMNVDGLGDIDTLQRIGELFNLHNLSMEDVVNVYQRPKIETYDEYLFLVSRMAQLEDGRLDTEQMSMFLGEGFVLTFQERAGDCFEPVRDRLRKGRGRIRSAGPDYLCYALLDSLIDAQFPILESFGERLEDIEDAVLLSPERAAVGEIFNIKRELLQLRRAIWPQREALSQILRFEMSAFTADTRLHLRDCYDHVIQLADMIETYRELASGLMDVYLSAVSNRTNDIMKVLTIFAAIFIPLSFIAGVYGMNFETDSPWNMPELHWRFGYAFALGLMAATALTLLWFFRRKGWLGSTTPGGKADRDER